MAAALHTATVRGHPTSIFFQPFSDRVFLSVTQAGSFGALIEARVDSRVDGIEEASSRVLLGPRDDDFAALAARRLLEGFRTSLGPGVPLLLALGLRAPTDVTAVREIVAAVEGLGLCGSGGGAGGGGGGVSSGGDP
jgi:hypothetical protein